MKTNKANITRFFFGCVLLFSLGSCEKLLEQKPPTEGGIILPSAAVRTADDLQEVLNSAYDVLANAYNGQVQNPNNLLADNLIKPRDNEDYSSVWARSTSIFNGTVGKAFAEYYFAVLRVNTVLANLDDVTGLTSENRQRIEAEARFIRGMCHFDLVRSWAQPYGYTANNSHPGIAIRTDILPSNAERSSVASVYSFALSDILFAKQNLPEINDVYATKWSATALEAEMRFQMHEYQMAYDLATKCINESPYIFDSEVNKFQFPQASPEALFYIFSAENGSGQSVTVDSRNGFFRNNYNSVDGNPQFRFQKEFFDKMTEVGLTLPRAKFFEESETDGNVTYVTTMMNETYFNVPVFTITQMKLIRAESAAEVGIDLATAINDINDIRTRAYNSSIENLLPGASAEDIIEAARFERRMEFPFNGQRFHDLKRIGAQGEDVIVRDQPWDCNGMILQFPSTEGTDLFELNPSGGC